MTNLDNGNSASVLSISRREMLSRTGTGFGMLGLAAMLNEVFIKRPQDRPSCPTRSFKRTILSQFRARLRLQSLGGTCRRALIIDEPWISLTFLSRR